MRMTASPGVERAALSIACPPERAWAIACLVGCGLFLGVAPAQAQFNTLPGADNAITLQPPTKQRLFRVESEQAFLDRISREIRRAGGAAPTFPPSADLPKEVYHDRVWGPRTCYTVPEYVCYGRLYFEQINMERYGWDLGPLSMVASPLIFFKDVAFLPYKLGTEPCRPCECSAGYCLPGDPVPLLLYRPKISLTGTAAELATIGALLAIFP
jgi:hypothetical protein